MTRFSVTYRLANSQADLDFVDIDLATDTPLYLDPYAIQIREDEWSTICGDHIRSFFNELLQALRDRNHARATHLLSNLHEPNETFLGQSRGLPNGRAIGEEKARKLANALIKSKAFVTGVLSDISEAELFIHGVGPDTISDLTTNVLRGLLANYTSEQCGLHEIGTQPVRSIGPVWSLTRRDWEAQTLNLPVWNGRPIMLVPKFSVRHSLSIDSQEFYNHHMVEFLKQEYLDSGDALVQVLQDGTRKVTKAAVKERHPFVKDNLALFVREHPEILELYKSIKGAKGPLTIEDLEKFFDERAYAATLIQKLTGIPSGPEEASKYHSIAMGICTFLFYPELICPIKEREIHEGRKRIDIKFTNAATEGFFHSMLVAPQTRAIAVFIECKNYSNDIANPDLDQLSGRFGHQRGFFGMLLCRSIGNRPRIVKKCRDTMTDGRGCMLVFEDADLIEMLTLVQNNNRLGINAFLRERFEEVSV